MKFPTGDRGLATLLVVPTTVVIVLLGIVQYRSSVDVSRAAAQRLTDSLQMSIMSWQQNLFRDLADICLRFRLDGHRIDLRDLEQAVSRFQTRQESADHRDLVAGIYLVSAGSAPPAEWHPGGRRFGRVAETPGLSMLRQGV